MRETQKRAGRVDGGQSRTPTAGSGLIREERSMWLGCPAGAAVTHGTYTQELSLVQVPTTVISFYLSHTTLVLPNMDSNLRHSVIERKVNGALGSNGFPLGWRGEPRNATAPWVENDFLRL